MLRQLKFCPSKSICGARYDENHRYVDQNARQGVRSTNLRNSDFYKNFVKTVNQ